MAVQFREFTFQNLNNVEVQLKLEVPIGSTVVETPVPAKGSNTFNFAELTDISAARITVDAGSPHGAEVETINLTGSPFKAFLTTLKARSNIGSIHGDMTVQY